MKISKLYIRNFITVMVIIIAAQVCIAGLFRIVGSAAGRKNFQSELHSIAFLLKEYIKTYPGKMDDKKINFFLKNLSETWSADIWLEDSKGVPLASSSQLSRPSFPEKMEETLAHGLLKNPRGGPLIYLIIKSGDNKKIFYIKKRNIHVFFDELYFAAGLGVITLVVALILFPISKKITVPLKKLTESANAISRGEFDITVEENSHDEVGELAKAFNIMSGRVLQMINGTKELTANISHQIRSPLSRISVSMEIMRNKIRSGKVEKSEEIISSIEHEISGIVNITEKIIELIRVDIAYKSNEYALVNIIELADGISNRFNDLMQQKSISYLTEISESRINLYCIKHDIEELFDILYDNAVRYSSKNAAIKLCISENSNNITIVLSNSTMNISGTSIESIFEPFKRYAPEKIPGNGLGLAIAKKIVENHGGSILAEIRDNIFSIKVIFNKNT